MLRTFAPRTTRILVRFPVREKRTNPDTVVPAKFELVCCIHTDSVHESLTEPKLCTNGGGLETVRWALDSMQLKFHSDARIAREICCLVLSMLYEPSTQEGVVPSVTCTHHTLAVSWRLRDLYAPEVPAGRQVGVGIVEAREAVLGSAVRDVVIQVTVPRDLNGYHSALENMKNSSITSPDDGLGGCVVAERGGGGPLGWLKHGQCGIPEPVGISIPP